MPLQKPERCSGLPLPKFASRTQCACKFGRRPQLCLGCFCRRQRLGYAATHSSLFLPLAAVAIRAPAGRAKFTPVDRGKLCGKVNLKSDFSCCMFTVKEVAFRLKPPRGRARRAQGVHLWAGGCAAEALPAAETAEAEQGQRSVFCEGAATPEAKAGHRNPGGLDTNNAGASLTAGPRRGTLSFVTQKFFCFGAINNRRNYWWGISFLSSHEKGGAFEPTGFDACQPLISIPVMVRPKSL